MTLRDALAEHWKKRDGSTDEKMVDYCVKSSIYVEINGIFINCGDAKPTIDKTLWYDDETEGPTVNFESFKHYNRHNMPRTVEERTATDNRKAYIANNYYLRNGETSSPLKAVVFKNEHYDRMNDDDRLATPEELALINNAINQARANYEKRLATYWKRYSKNVRASGYWANR